MHARLRVDERSLGIVIELAPLPQQYIDLGRSSIGNESSLSSDRLDCVRIPLVSLAAITEDDRAHLRHMTGVDECSLESDRDSDAKQKLVIDARGLDDDADGLDAACARAFADGQKR
jgi:hypothetical protein